MGSLPAIKMGTLEGFPNPPAMTPPKAGVAGWAVRAEIPEGDGAPAGDPPTPHAIKAGRANAAG